MEAEDRAKEQEHVCEEKQRLVSAAEQEIIALRLTAETAKTRKVPFPRDSDPCSDPCCRRGLQPCSPCAR